MTVLDHIAVAANRLEDGLAHVKAALGVDVPLGGQHTQMGTHNAVARLTEATYFEVIAPDPEQPKPPHARWFGFDTPRVAARLAQGPALLAWIAATDDIEGAIAAAKGVGVDYGDPIRLTRGDLTWRFAYRVDGDVPLDGAAPCLIDWCGSPHPAANMAPLGLSLDTLTVTTPEAPALIRLLDALGLADRPDIGQGPAPALTATFRSSDGATATLT